MFNQANYDLDTFSGRLNALLDIAGNYAPVKDGRRNQVAEEFGLKTTSAANYLHRDLVPKRAVLESMVEDILTKVTGTYTVQEVCAWLMYNVHNPFTEGSDGVPEKAVLKVHGAIQMAGALMGRADVFDHLPVHIVNQLTRDVYHRFSEKGRLEMKDHRVTQYLTEQVKTHLDNVTV